MNFKQWLEGMAGQPMDPLEAMKVLGLEDKVGKPISSDELGDAYRPLALANHPDRNPRDQEARKRFEQATEAFESLSQYAGKGIPLPGGAGGGPTQVYQPTHQFANRFSQRDLEAWARELVSNGFFQVVVRGALQWLPMDVGFGGKLNRPIGSQERTFRITGYDKGAGLMAGPEAKILELVKGGIAQTGGIIPNSIIDLGFVNRDNYREAWITWVYYIPGLTTGRPMERFRCVSFKPVVKQQKKPAGVGMKRTDVETKLRLAGIQYLSGTKNANYGFPEQKKMYDTYLFQLGSKVVRFVRKYKGEYGRGAQYGTVDSEYYGKLTPAWLDHYIARLKKKLGKEAA